MCSTDYDQPKVYNQKYQKAKKAHQCTECRRIIDIGETYQYTFYVGYGDKSPSIFKTCSNCVIAQQWLLRECSGYLHGGLLEEIEEHAYEYRKMFLYRWLINIRSKWKYRSL